MKIEDGLHYATLASSASGSSLDSGVFFSECGGPKNGLSGQLIANDTKV
jgi:hypothetical protein